MTYDIPSAGVVYGTFGLHVRRWWAIFVHKEGDGKVPSWGGVVVPYQSKRPPTLQPSCQQRGQSPRSSGMRLAATLSSRLIVIFSFQHFRPSDVPLNSICRPLQPRHRRCLIPRHGITRCPRSDDPPQQRRRGG